MRVSPGKAVRIEYELKRKGGETIESSTDRGAATFVAGRGKLLPALEKRIVGLEPGQEASGELSGAEAFDEDELPTIRVPRIEFPADEAPEPGRMFRAHTHSDESVRLRVLGVDEEAVTVRIVHPLAEDDLEYRVRVLAVDTPPPPPARAIGIDSTAIVIDDTVDN
jgi:FKBP-type peptidyl-prolyl cis-trans isomerase 2